MNTEFLLKDAVARGNELHIDLLYPRIPENHNSIVVGLCDVRAADGVKISYDFERDGWKIEQASVFSWDANDEICDPCWIEVAFVKAWASQLSETQA